MVAEVRRTSGAGRAVQPHSGQSQSRAVLSDADYRAIVFVDDSLHSAADHQRRSRRGVHQCSIARAAPRQDVRSPGQSRPWMDDLEGLDLDVRPFVGAARRRLKDRGATHHRRRRNSDVLPNGSFARFGRHHHHHRPRDFRPRLRYQANRAGCPPTYQDRRRANCKAPRCPTGYCIAC
jgi:hypothetical protein